MSLNDKEKSSKNNDILEIYKIFVEMADRVSLRRQLTHSFYLSVNTAFIGGIAYFLKSDGLTILEKSTVFFTGIVICFLWRQCLLSYKSLNDAKFEVICSLEDHLPAKPYKDEWAILHNGDGTKHKPFYKTEIYIPFVFMVSYIILILTF